MYISAYKPNEPAAGCSAAISARAHITVIAIRAPPRKLTITAGPASFTEIALPRNNPVPMLEPRAIMEIWAGVRLRCRPASRSRIGLGSTGASVTTAGSLSLVIAPHRNRGPQNNQRIDWPTRRVACPNVLERTYGG